MKQVLVVLINPHMGAVHRLDHLPVNTTGGNPQFPPQLLSLHRCLFQEKKLSLLSAELFDSDFANISSDFFIAAVADFNADLLADLEMGSVEDVEFKGANGDAVQMFVLYPPGFDPAKRYPLVHNIHGGPHSTYGDIFHYRWNSQVFAAPGYVVAMVNFHGSTSFGQDFAASIHGAWGEMPSEDILAATDALIERGFVDTYRLINPSPVTHRGITWDMRDRPDEARIDFIREYMSEEQLRQMQRSRPGRDSLADAR